MKRSALLLATLLCAGCAMGGKSEPAAAPAAPKAQLGTWGVDLTAMDKSVKPGDDFFAYASGTWAKTAEIPPDRSSIGAFQNLRIKSEKDIGTIIADLEAKPADQLDGEAKKLRDLYDGYMDAKQIDDKGMAPAATDIAHLQGLKTRADVAAAMGTVEYQINVPFNFYIGADDKHPNEYIASFYQGGLGMPDRDYYLKTDKEILDTQVAYKKYLATMLGHAGLTNTEARAEKIYAFEKKIAEAHWKNEDSRDADKIYNVMSISALKKYAPGFDWSAFFKAAGLSEKGPKGERNVLVAQNTAFPKMAKIMASTPISVLRDYLTVGYLHAYAAYLPAQVDADNFAFYGTVLSGNTQQLPRETRAAHLLDGTLGEPLGKLYVAKFFPPESKAKAEKLVANLLKAYDQDIRVIPWMTEETKVKALDKLHKFTPYIGYPDKWRDYSGLQIDRNDLLGNMKRSANFEWHYNLDRIDQPVDKTEWGMTPPTVNAYYNPSANKIVFPAAILQPPFFDPNADDAVNYGAIGAVIGHEISHGFDDQGSKYNGDGVLSNWWTDADRKAFDARTDKLVAQYDSYEALPGLHVNGRFTLGENIGDLSGAAIALKAYALSLDGKPAPVIDGYTGTQRFFLGFAQIWRGKYRDGALRAQVLSNEHSPAMFRILGPTRNNDAWYEAFDVKPGDKLYIAPEDRVKLW